MVGLDPAEVPLMATKLEARAAEVAAEIEALRVELATAEEHAVETHQQVSGDLVLHLVTEAEATQRRAEIACDLGERRERIAVLEASGSPKCGRWHRLPTMSA
jgi:hypothetical protein